MSLSEKAYYYAPESGAVELSESLRNYLKEHIKVNRCLQEALRSRIQGLLDDGAADISITELLEVQRADRRLRKEHPDVKLQHRFSAAAFSSNLHIPEMRLTEPNPALIERRKRLQVEAENREYERMTGHLIKTAKRHNQGTESIASEWRTVNNQMIAILNCLLAGAGGFAFGYIGLTLLGFDLAYQTRILLGFTFFVIILFIEMYFFAKYVLGSS